jgi:hypothetical protein
MARKKVKLDFYEMCSYLQSIKNGFFECDSYKVVHKGEEYRGTIYKLSDSLTDNDKAWFSQWKNVKLFITQAQYAPEIKHNAIFLGRIAFKD